MSAPRATKQTPNITVPRYPILKSSSAVLVFVFSGLAICFYIVHKECHTDTSKGAGIHPIKAIKKVI